MFGGRWFFSSASLDKSAFYCLSKAFSRVNARSNARQKKVLNARESGEGGGVISLAAECYREEKCLSSMRIAYWVDCVLLAEVCTMCVHILLGGCIV